MSGDGDLIFSDSLLLDLTKKDTEDPLIPEKDLLAAVPGILIQGEGEAPMTTAELTKDLLSEERSKIKLHDLVSQKIREVLSATAEDYFPTKWTWSAQEFESRLHKYESAMAELLQVQSFLAFGVNRIMRQS